MNLNHQLAHYLIRTHPPISGRTSIGELDREVTMDIEAIRIARELQVLREAEWEKRGRVGEAPWVELMKVLWTGKDTGKERETEKSMRAGV